MLSSCLFLLALPFLVSAATVSTVTVPGPTVATTYVQTATGPPSAQYTDSYRLRTSVLNSTNFFRWQHNASFVSWNASLASYAATYAANCIWSHSHGPQGYGENLAMGYNDMTRAVDAWGNERDLYTFSPPDKVTGFSEDTGHFTQLVWKTTTTVGCAAQICNGRGGVAGYMVVCEYWPPGNVVGTQKQGGANVWFKEDVDSQIHTGSAGFDEAAAIAGAVGANATGTSTGGGKPSTGSTLHVGTVGLFALVMLHSLL